MAHTRKEAEELVREFLTNDDESNDELVRRLDPRDPVVVDGEVVDRK